MNDWNNTKETRNQPWPQPVIFRAPQLIINAMLLNLHDYSSIRMLRSFEHSAYILMQLLQNLLAATWNKCCMKPFMRIGIKANRALLSLINIFILWCLWCDRILSWHRTECKFQWFGAEFWLLLGEFFKRLSGNKTSNSQSEVEIAN